MQIATCPFCNRRVVTSLNIDLGKNDKAIWYQCSCGCFFKKDKSIDKKVFDEAFKKEYARGNGISERLDYQRKVYIPLISELTPGRVALVVGPTIDRDIVELRKLGFVAEGIDLIKDDNPNIIKGDFEYFEFDKQYDIIFMQDVIASFDDPIKAIVRANSLLRPGGVLVISSPEPKLINEVGYSEWGCWNNKQHNIYLCADNLVKLVQNIGMEVILKRENIEKRFNCWNNTHIIALKIYGGQDNGEADNVTNIKQGAK